MQGRIFEKEMTQRRNWAGKCEMPKREGKKIIVKKVLHVYVWFSWGFNERLHDSVAWTSAADGPKSNKEAEVKPPWPPVRNLNWDEVQKASFFYSRLDLCSVILVYLWFHPFIIYNVSDSATLFFIRVSISFHNVRPVSVHTKTGKSKQYLQIKMG